MRYSGLRPGQVKHAFNVKRLNTGFMDEEHLLTRLSPLVEQIRDARCMSTDRLPAAGDAVHQQGGRVRVADDLVLLSSGWWR